MQLSFGDASSVHNPNGGSAMSSSTRGVYNLGHTPSIVSTIDYVIISSNGGANDLEN